MTEKVIYSSKNDSTYANPSIDEKEVRTRRVNNNQELKYTYIHGHFEGTGVKFMFCFPEKEYYQGRFFQHLSPFPGPDEELASLNREGEEDIIGFCLSHGAAFVESNMGSTMIFGGASDPTIFYKSSAAVAEFCRQTAQELFGEHRVYGYVFGGSGGGYKTMSCIENTSAFDGALPFVIGSPISLPNCLTSFVLAKRLLRNCFDKITEALEPGGSGEIYEGLTEAEKAGLKEIISIGVPPRVISGFGDADDGALPVLLPGIKGIDPEYFTDFWTKPGYEGTMETESAIADRIFLRTSVIDAGFIKGQEIIRAHEDRNGTDDAFRKMLSDANGAYIDVKEVPVGDLFLHGVDVVFESGKAAGKRLHLAKIDGNRLILGPSFGVDNFQEVIGLVEEKDEVLLDNSDYVAAQYFHRHQIPEDPSFHCFDQYKDENGKPIGPQRPVISYGFTAGGCGSVQDGHIQGKVIIMNNLMDGDFPWQADWYKNKIEEVNGTDASKDLVRVYYNDNAPHGDVSEGGDMTRVVSYLGMLNQGLLDLAEWTEGRVMAPATSGYELIDNQIILDEDPSKRGGLQPKFDLFANGKKVITIKKGETVSFEAIACATESAGRYESIDWSFDGTPNFIENETKIELSEANNVQTAHIFTSKRFDEAGIVYVVARVRFNRNKGDIYTGLKNLDRVKVIVTE